MKRIYACFAIVAALLATAFYSSFQVQRFADDISTDLDCAIEAIRNSDLPTARQALARGADRCDRMREKMNHLLRTEDFTELEAALRTELLAHAGTGWVYVYDPADRSVQRVVGGVAGASGLALSPDGRTLYVSDLGNRCVWNMDADARELTAGGKNCQSAFSGLPGYPGALAMEADGTLYISYRWARSGWLEKNADSTLLRGIALRAGQNLQEKLFGLPSDAPCAEAVSTADGSWKRTFIGGSSCTAVCPVGSKVYLDAADSAQVLSARI